VSTRRRGRAKDRSAGRAAPTPVAEVEPEAELELEEPGEEAEPGDGEARDAAKVPEVRAVEVAPEADEAEEAEPVTALVPTDSLQRYLAEVRRNPLLGPEEEHALAIAWKEHGDRAAAARLVTANLRLVIMIARQYQQAFKNFLDLIQEGNIGLLEAVKNFDPYRGVRFPSYAVWWIRAYIIRYVMNNWRLVKLGTTQAQRKLFFNLQREKEKLEREGIRPDAGLLAERLAVKKAEVIEMEQRLGSRDMSVDAPIGDDGDASMLDVLADKRADVEAQFSDAQVRQMIGEKIREFGATLRDKEKVIFDERMVAEEPLTLQEIGEKYGISRERVRQIEERIKKRLRTYLVEEIPDIRDVDVRLSLGEST
jgi:RNA polymerase sigma-32 factor